MKKSFYDNVVILDDFKKLETPTSEQIKSLLAYLDHDEYAKYFFLDLENPAWVLHLHENGFFSKVPPPLEDSKNPGYFGMPAWLAGEYLKRKAVNFPEVIKDVALTFDTENSRAIRTMFEALLKIPANITAKTVGAFKGLLKTPFVNFMMLSHEMGLIMEYLAKGDEFVAALKVLEILLEPVEAKDQIHEEIIIASTRYDMHWLNKACKDNLPTLTEINPINVIGISETQLINAIDLEHNPKFNNKENKINSFWRINIVPQSELNYERDIKHLLVNIVISALEKACERKFDETTVILSRYIDSDYSIFRRIAIYMLQIWGKQYPDLIETAYQSHSKRPSIAGQSEFNQFLEAQYGNLSKSTQDNILWEISVRGPDPEWVDRLIEYSSDKSEEISKEDKRLDLIEKWQLRELDRFANHLKGEDKEYYEYLLEKYEKPLPRQDDGVVGVSWEGPESPIEHTELAEKSIGDVIKFLVEYIPESEDSFLGPSRVGLGRALEIDVQARANEYANEALSFDDETLPFIYHTHLLTALENAAKNQEKFNLPNVITLCELIANEEKDKFEKQDLEVGLIAAKLAVLNLIEELLRVKVPYIEKEVLGKIGQIIVKLLHQDDPYTRDEMGDDFDSATRSLNSTQGKAMHCLVSYGLYCERNRKKEMGDEGKPEMVPLMKINLNEILDSEKNSNLTVHSVFGWYFPQFIYLDKEWAVKNREKIFPVEPEKVNYWRAAWTAYIRFSDVYTNVFPELISQYQKALEEIISIGKEQGFDRLDEKLATHILKAYHLDMIGLNSKDNLISLYYQNADDDTRSHGNFWLSKVLDSQKPSSQDILWQKIWSLWQWRTKEATTSNEKTGYVKEISNFSRLLKNVPLDLSETYSTLGQIIYFISDGFNNDEVIKYLGKNCEEHPRLAIQLLHELVISNQTLYLLDEAKTSIELMLENAAKADVDSKDKAREIINIFGERGDYSWRPWLDKLIT